MLRHFISTYTRISFYNNSKRLIFPLEVGKININDKDKFTLSYERVRKNIQNANMIYSIEKQSNNNYIQSYNLEKGQMVIKIPYVYNKTINVKDSDILCVQWEESSDYVNTITIYSKNE